MLEPDDRKLSSPVLRGPALSNGGWPLGREIVEGRESKEGKDGERAPPGGREVAFI
jgi:hypothetical protein